LNAGEWLRLGFFMDVVPPVIPGQKSTYTPVPKVEATSFLVDDSRSLRNRVRRAFPPSKASADRIQSPKDQKSSDPDHNHDTNDEHLVVRIKSSTGDPIRNQQRQPQ
jgi:hypothetical protein